MVRGAFGIFACALVLSQQAQAISAPEKPIIPNPTRIVTNFDTALLASLAHDLGLEAQVTTEEGGSFVVVKLESGAILAVPKCSKDKPTECRAVEFLAAYSYKNVPLAALNDFNNAQSFSQAYSHEGNIYLSRTELANYGISAGNVALGMALFIEIASKLTESLQKSGASVSLTLPQTTGKALAPSPLAAPAVDTSHVVLPAGTAYLDPQR